MHIVHLISSVRDIIIVFLDWRGSTAREIVFSSVVIPCLQWNTGRIEALIISDDDFLVSLFANNNTGISPRKVVLLPKGVDREDKGVNRVGKDVDNHPSNVLPLSFNDKDQGLQTINRRNHDD